jgi:hypothetical protein
MPCAHAHATAPTAAAEWNKWANILLAQNSIQFEYLGVFFDSKGRALLSGIEDAMEYSVRVIAL